MKTVIRNIFYWVHRLIFDCILRRYKNIEINFTEEAEEFIFKFAIENDMTVSQTIEYIIKTQIKKYK